MHYQPILRTAATPLPFGRGALTPLEWQVVVLASHDDRTSVCRGGPVRRAFDALFGIRRANPLADPRLEALRRFCVGRRMKPTETQRAAILAECERYGLTTGTLRAAAMLSDLARQV